MSRLRAPHYGSKLQPEVVELVHNEVISLCQKMYTTIAGIEIDGIICISLLDTKEQQVVKIHKTLKSVVADASKKVLTRKSSAYPRIAGILSGSPQVSESSQRFITSENIQRLLTSDQQTSNIPNDQRGQSAETDYRADISVLNDLLKRSNTLIRSDMNPDKEEAIETSRSRRKRNKPTQRRGSREENRESKERGVSAGEYNTDNNENDSTEKELGLVIVKEEPFVPGYEELLAPATTTDTDQNYSVQGGDVADNRNENDQDVVGSNQDSENMFSTADDRGSSSEPTEQQDETTEPFTETLPSTSDTVVSEVEGSVSVKVENVSDESEYGVAKDGAGGASRGETDDGQASNQSSMGPDNLYEGGSDPENKLKTDTSKRHWLYGIGKNLKNEGEAMSDSEIPVSEVSKSALIDKLIDGAMAHKGNPPPMHYVQHSERDPRGRSWIEMVKDNVSKYQAALMRSANKKEEPPARSASALLKTLASPSANSNYLKSLLKEPSPYGNKSNVFEGGAEGTGASNSGSERSRSTSVSPAPQIKIEVDEEQEYPECDSVSSQDKDEGDKPPSGKLESRYPALFNQLQQAKQSTPTSFEQSDSLVNRLPFISFQELFAPTNPRMSESTTRNLLEKAKVCPYPPKTNVNKKKSVWKWKKRIVKPKMTDVESYSQEQSESTPKKTPRKRTKGDDNEDSEWTPSEGLLTTEEVAKKKIKTRLSSGEKPRMNFAEIENSDIEIEEEEENEIEVIKAEVPDDPIQLVSAYCEKKCGLRFDSFTELKIHEENCTWGSDIVPVGGAEGGAATASASGTEGVGTSGEGYKCTICELDFNQEYRWHYHMVKVHGVAMEKADLFR